MAEQPLFLAEQLVKTFPGVRALDRATLRLEAGSIHALLGENGAGKSTLIKILTGVHRADSGRMVLGAAEISPSSPRDAARAGIGVVHQERNLVPGFSIGENIVLQGIPARRGLVDRAAIRAPRRMRVSPSSTQREIPIQDPTATLSVPLQTVMTSLNHETGVGLLTTLTWRLNWLVDTKLPTSWLSVA